MVKKATAKAATTDAGNADPDVTTALASVVGGLQALADAHAQALAQFHAGQYGLNQAQEGFKAALGLVPDELPALKAELAQQAAELAAMGGGVDWTDVMKRALDAALRHSEAA